MSQSQAEPDETAKHFSERLIQIHDSEGLLTADDRDLLMLVAGFVRGQAARINDLERALKP